MSPHGPTSYARARYPGLNDGYAVNNQALFANIFAKLRASLRETGHLPVRTAPYQSHFSCRITPTAGTIPSRT